MCVILRIQLFKSVSPILWWTGKPNHEPIYHLGMLCTGHLWSVLGDGVPLNLSHWETVNLFTLPILDTLPKKTKD